ncbi:MAG: metal-sensing transcriptional repressor [Oscillospiraceae bacterium]|nr:metal-sensing transcriptional repressor [Oscillospiraceae bacterium]
MDETTEMSCCKCSERKKVRGEQERRELMNRLKRIEGQVRGLQRMLDEDAYCPDILVQASAVNSALNGFCRTLLAEHLRTCVSEDIRDGREEAVDELMETLKNLMR